jgi:hypothetical protein
MKRPRIIFNETVSDEIQEVLVATVFRAYKDAHDDLSKLDYPQAWIHDLYGQHLRCKLDMYLSNLGKRYPEQVSAIINPNESHNSFHSLVTIGNVYITQSAVQHPGDLPRSALFRSNYASENQLWFDIDEEKSQFQIADVNSAPSTRLYSVLLHGPNENDLRYIPGFLRIAFPSRHDFRLDDDIDLFLKFKHLDEEITSQEIESVKDEAEVQLIQGIPQEEYKE